MMKLAFTRFFLDWRPCCLCTRPSRSCPTARKLLPVWVTSSKRFAAAVSEISLFPTPKKHWKCSRIKITSMQKEKLRCKLGPRVCWSIWMKVRAQFFCETQYSRRLNTELVWFSDRYPKFWFQHCIGPICLKFEPTSLDQFGYKFLVEASSFQMHSVKKPKCENETSLRWHFDDPLTVHMRLSFQIC